MKLGSVWLVVGLTAAGCAAPARTARIEGPVEIVTGGAPSGGARGEADAGEATVVADPEPRLPPVPAGDPFAGIEPADAAFARALGLAREAWSAARAAFQAGDIETARLGFDRAVDALVAGELGRRPDVRAAADSLTAEVARYEAAWAEADGADDGDEPAAADALASVELPEVASASEPPPAPPAPGSRLHGDFPIVVNNQVQAMLDIYKGRLKDEILPAFERAGRWLPLIQDIFRDEGVPLDLAWLSLVESGFKPHAYSRAAARGLWQFIRSTGRQYGLEVDYWRDERSDPVKSTRAAARHLKDLYAEFGDWYLALAAYNAGAGKVSRAIQRSGTRDYWAVASTRHLLRETKNYVPGLLATLLIADDPVRHGFDISFELPWSYEEVEVESPADLGVLARAAGTSVEELRRLNPELRRAMTPGNRDRYLLRIPLGTGATFREAWAAVPPGERLRFAVHLVRRGETLARIARRYGTNVEGIVAVNGLGRGRAVAPGTELRIPLSDEYYPSAGWREPERRGGEARRGVVHHRVRRGETASGIARRYGVSVDDLRRWNRLGRSATVRVGMRLTIHSTSRGRAEKTSPRTLHHRVRRGETLAAIAGRYGVGVADLARWNGVRDAENLLAGRTLKIHVTR